jgi:hydrogenase maturation protease
MHLLRDALPPAQSDARLTTLIIGVGSPFGDDRVGWDVVSALEAQPWFRALPPGRVQTCVCDRPGVGLIQFLHRRGEVIIVDAARGREPGSVHWLTAADTQALRPASSHGFGVAEALGLAAALGQTPDAVHVLAVGVSEFESGRLSGPVRDAVPRALHRIRCHLPRILSFTRD